MSDDTLLGENFGAMSGSKAKSRGILSRPSEVLRGFANKSLRKTPLTSRSSPSPIIVNSYNSSLASNNINEGTKDLPLAMPNPAARERQYSQGSAEGAARVSPLLTDFYEVTMVYNYYMQGRHEHAAVFDVFFRENPFKGEYTLFAGLSDVISFLKNFKITDDEADYLVRNLQTTGSIKGPKETESARQMFKDYLLSLSKAVDSIEIKCIEEGSVVFPRVPVMTLKGPLGLLQLIETPVLNLTGFASLVTTNASRMVDAANSDRLPNEPPRGLLEFGLRRAQAPGGGLAASKYAIVGGFNGTSNCLAGFLNQKAGVNISGTMAHAFICGFQGIALQDEQAKTYLKGKIYVNYNVTKLATSSKAGPIKDYISGVDFLDAVVSVRKYFLNHPEIFSFDLTNFKEPSDSELLAFSSYAMTFPGNFLALVDTYDSIRSGVPNYMIVSIVLMFLGYKPKGIRLDSGNLRSLSVQSRVLLKRVQKEIANIHVACFARQPLFRLARMETDGFSSGSLASSTIVATDGLNEEKILELYSKKTGEPDCEINVLGVGTHLATCQAQPALGMVYKLTEVEHRPTIKFSNEAAKQTFPGEKSAFRLFRGTRAIADIMSTGQETVESLSGIVGKEFSWSCNRKEPTKVAISRSKAKDAETFVFDGIKPLYSTSKVSKFVDFPVGVLKERVANNKESFSKEFLLNRKTDKKDDDNYPVLLAPKLLDVLQKVQNEYGF